MMGETMEAIPPRMGRRAAKLLWVHVVLFAVIAVACYLSPETPFGESAWLPLSRLSALLFAAALTAIVIVLIGSARSGNARAESLGLLAALVLDVQIPILMFSQPASLEYLQSKVGVPWFAVPLVSFVMVGLTVQCLSRLNRERRAAAASF
jgi:hypothetical protein